VDYLRATTFNGNSGDSPMDLSSQYLPRAIKKFQAPFAVIFIVLPMETTPCLEDADAGAVLQSQKR
jgi:hypothetical protein